MTIRNSARLFHHVLFNMGDLHLVLPALNLSTLNAGISIMMQQVRLMMFSLNMVDYSMSFLLLSTWVFFCWTSRGDHSEPFLLFDFLCGTLPSCSKVMGWGGGPWDFSVSPRPLGFGFLGFWGPGLTIKIISLHSVKYKGRHPFDGRHQMCHWKYKGNLSSFLWMKAQTLFRLIHYTDYLENKYAAMFFNQLDCVIYALIQSEM